MTITTGPAVSETFEAAVGRRLLELAEEWRNLQDDPYTNSHTSGVLRDVFGALALQLGVRATELKAGNTSADLLPQILKDFRAEFAEAMAKLAR